MSNIPDNYVEIEVEIDDKGNFKRKIVGHGANTSCKLEKDDELMEDVLAELGETDDYDHTDEYYEQEEKTIRVKPMKDKCTKVPKQDDKEKITLGFGT